MRPHNTLAAAATALLLATLTACGSSEPAKPSASKDKSAKPAVEEPAVPDAKDKAEDAKKEFEKSLDDLDKALGETIGVHEGTYEVTNSPPEYDDPAQGLDDEYIATGAYTTKGPASPGVGCYWARMREASGGLGSIIANDLTSGRAIVTLKEGEYFKTSGCKPWTHKGD